MALFDRFRKAETRNLENPNAPVSAEDFLQVMGWGELTATAGVTVNTDTALGVPAVWAAVNFLSGTLAGLPLHVYRKTSRGVSAQQVRLRASCTTWPTTACRRLSGASICSTKCSLAGAA